MTTAEISFLGSDLGRDLIKQYENYTDDELVKLLLKSAKKADVNFLSAAVTLIKLRRKATGKFSRYSEMFFTTLGLEQSTSELIALHIASRFKSDWCVTDLTCSIGGNLISLAQRCRQVVAVDNNEENISCAERNALVYNVKDKIEFIIGDAFDNIKPGCDAFFLDPARDREGQTKTRSILNSSPALLEILPKIFAVTENVGVKISPAFDYQELRLLPLEPEVEIISEDNNCKVAMLWFGDLKTASRRATCFSKGNIYTYIETADLKSVPFTARPKQYLYEPNKAISKAGLVDELASEYALAKLNLVSSFLTSDELVAEDKPGLMRSFKILACESYNSKSLKKFLRAKEIERADIIVKGFPFSPEQLYKELKIKEGGGLFLIFTVLSDEKRYCILAEKT